jgi:hypothetical protein
MEAGGISWKLMVFRAGWWYLFQAGIIYWRLGDVLKASGIYWRLMVFIGG